MDVDGSTAVPPVSLMDGPSAAFRYCNRCGAALSVGQITCDDCLDRATRPVPVVTSELLTNPVKPALALYFALLAVSIVAVALAVVRAGKPVNIEIGATVGITLIAALWVLASWRTVLPLFARPVNVVWLSAGVGMSFVTFGIAAAVILGLSRFMRLPNEKVAEPLIAAGYGWGFITLLVAVQPALIEELAFRGVILGALRNALSPAEAVVVSALMFMILHLSVGRFPHTLAMGLATGYLRVRTRSIYPCIALHFSHNFLCVAAEWAGFNV